MTGQELAERQLRCLRWSGFAVFALAGAAVSAVQMILARESEGGLGLLAVSLLFLGSAGLALRRRHRQRRAVFAYVDRQLAIVTRRCREHGLRPLPEYTPPPGPCERLARAGEERKAAQDLVDGMLRHVGLPETVAVRVAVPDPAQCLRDAARGVRPAPPVCAYARDESGRGTVALPLHAECGRMLPALCRQVVRHFLYEHGIADSRTDDREVQTELAAVCLGFGTFLARTCSRSRGEAGCLRPFVIRHAIRVLGRATACALAAARPA